jgi:hypothetical protein
MSHGSTAHWLQQDAHSSSNGAATTAAVSGSGSSGGSSALSALVKPDVLQHFSSRTDAEAALDQVLQYGQRLLLLRANDWSALAAEGGSGERGTVVWCMSRNQ